MILYYTTLTSNTWGVEMEEVNVVSCIRTLSVHGVLTVRAVSVSTSVKLEYAAAPRLIILLAVKLKARLLLAGDAVGSGKISG